MSRLLGRGRYMSRPEELGMGTKAARNDDCPCGSHRKYKRCCLDYHEDAVRAHRRGYPWGTDWSIPSNRINDEIVAGNLDHADHLAQQYLRDFPDQPDGLWRQAQIAEARGRPDDALAAFRRLSALTEVLDRETPSDPEYRAWITGEIERLRPVTTAAAPQVPTPRGA
jgi:hypothetical protein